MTAYSIVDFILHTDIDFPELSVTIASDQAKTIDLRHTQLAYKLDQLKCFHSWQQNDNSIWSNFYNSGAKFYIEYPNNCIFELDKNLNTIHYEIISDLPMPDFRHLFLDQIFPLFLSLNDYLVLHASALEKDSQVYIFVGKTGSGKSTISSELVKHMNLISDDFVPIKIDSKTQIFNSYPVIRLWQKINRFKRLEELQHSSKNRYLLDINNCTRQIFSAKAIFLLERDSTLAAGEIEIESIAKEEIFSKTLQNLFILESNDTVRQSWVLDKLTSLINSIPGYVLRYSDIINHDYNLYQAISKL